MELLCYLQKKHSPLRQWSPFFQQHHPHRYIALFRQLGESPNAIHIPKIGIWQEYRRELGNVFESARLLLQPLPDALAFCQRRVSESWEWHRKSLERRHGMSARLFGPERSRPPEPATDRPPPPTHGSP